MPNHLISSSRTAAEQGISITSDLLDFSIPAFTRLTWVSESAKEVWLPRLQRIVQAWEHIEWATVANGNRSCAIVTLSFDDFINVSHLWVKEGISMLPLGSSNPTNPFSDPRKKSESRYLQLVVGKTGALQDFKYGLERDDHNLIGHLLNYPDCCQQFLKDVWEQQGLQDTVWPMAVNSPPQELLFSAAEVSGPPQTNILWRWLNIRAICHLPCCFSCSKTVEAADGLISTGNDIGYVEEMKWLLELLSWPVEWTALHGIAEIKTPIMRICTSTDATGSKYTVRYKGSKYPEEGVHALNFPYQLPAKRRVTQSQGYQNGLNNPIAVLPMIS